MVVKRSLVVIALVALFGILVIGSAAGTIDSETDSDNLLGELQASFADEPLVDVTQQGGLIKITVEDSATTPNDRILSVLTEDSPNRDPRLGMKVSPSSGDVGTQDAYKCTQDACIDVDGFGNGDGTGTVERWRSYAFQYPEDGVVCDITSNFYVARPGQPLPGDLFDIEWAGGGCWSAPPNGKITWIAETDNVPRGFLDGTTLCNVWDPQGNWPGWPCAEVQD